MSEEQSPFRGRSPKCAEEPVDRRAPPGYRVGLADGLREAAAILGGLEEEVARRLERGAVAKQTQHQRRVRLQAYRVGRTRVTTALRAVERRRQPLGDKLKEIGL